MLEYEGSMETNIVGLQASGMVHTTKQRGRAKGEAQERKGGNTMKDVSKQAQTILSSYVENLKNEVAEDEYAAVTTYCYDNFAQGIRAVMPDVTEEVIDQMYFASGFGVSKYRKGLSVTRWFENTETLNHIEGVIGAILANMSVGTPLSLADVVDNAGVKLCRKWYDYQDKSYRLHEDRRICQRALNALIDAGICTKTAVKTCGHVHIYLYTFC